MAESTIERLRATGILTVTGTDSVLLKRDDAYALLDIAEAAQPVVDCLDSPVVEELRAALARLTPTHHQDKEPGQ